MPFVLSSFVKSFEYVNFVHQFSSSIFIMWIAISALNLALAVMLGAFGAHGLKSIATVEQLAWWSTATQYFSTML